MYREWLSLRDGRSKHLQLDRFVEALEDPGELYIQSIIIAMELHVQQYIGHISNIAINFDLA